MRRNYGDCKWLYVWVMHLILLSSIFYLSNEKFREADEKGLFHFKYFYGPDGRKQHRIKERPLFRVSGGLVVALALPLNYCHYFWTLRIFICSFSTM